MKVLCYLEQDSSARFSLMRAASILDLECVNVITERQLTQLAEIHFQQTTPCPLLIVTTDEHDRAIREILARAPKARILLLTAQSFAELPAFISNSAQIDGFYFSPSRNCGPEFFLNFISQQSQSAPQPLKDLMRPHTKTIHLTLDDPNSRAHVQSQASSFYLWCLGDETDPILQESRDQILDILNELILNVEQHCFQTKSHSTESKAELEICFDGVHIGSRIKDLSGSLTREHILGRLTDGSSQKGIAKGFPLLFQRSQRVIINLIPNKSSEIIFFNRLNFRVDPLGQAPLAVEIREWKEN